MIQGEFYDFLQTYGLTRKELSVYTGVSVRTLTSWFKSRKKMLHYLSLGVQNERLKVDWLTTIKGRP